MIFNLKVYRLFLLLIVISILSLFHYTHSTSELTEFEPPLQIKFNLIKKNHNNTRLKIGYSYINEIFNIISNSKFNLVINPISEFPSERYIANSNKIPFSENFLKKFISLNDDELSTLKKSHNYVVNNLPETYPLNLYNGNGIVYVGGGQFNWLTLLSIHNLRNLGSRLPIEVLIPKLDEYEIELCGKILPKLNAKCIYMPYILPKNVYKNFHVKGYQYKVLAILLSSFKNVLLIDSDNIPVKNPDKLFILKPFTNSGLIVWPDYWRRSTSPYFYQIAGLKPSMESLPKYDEIRGGYFMENLETDEKSLVKEVLHEKVPAEVDSLLGSSENVLVNSIISPHLIDVKVIDEREKREVYNEESEKGESLVESRKGESLVESKEGESLVSEPENDENDQNEREKSDQSNSKQEKVSDQSSFKHEKLSDQSNFKREEKVTDPVSELPLHQRVNAIPDPTSESGQLMISKKTHMKPLLLSLYYNIYGPDQYYSLFSQGASGEGDKETFLAATVVSKKPFYQVGKFLNAFGNFNSDNNFVGAGMGQYDPVQDYIHNQDSTKPEPSIMFVHANFPKLNPWVLKQQKKFIDENGNRFRLYGTGMVETVGYDFELLQYKNSFELLCVQKVKLATFEDIPLKDLCDEITTHLEFLESTKAKKE